MQNLLPPLTWLKGYTLKTFGLDSVAGMTLFAYAIPVSLAYATLAGLPPQYGVFGYLIGGIFYAMLGSSRHLAVGPTSAISMLIGITLSGLSNGDPQRWVDLASLTALVFAVISILSYILRLSSIINFISETVLVGFKIGAAITIGLTQLPKLFGVPGGGDDFISRVITLAHQIPSTNMYVFGFGLVALILMFAGQKFLPGKPVAIVIVIISILVISFTGLGDHGFKTVGVIPAGLPSLHIPVLHVEDLKNVLPLAVACFLLAYIESVSAAKTIAQQHGYDIDARQELLALGFTNFAIAMFHGYPVSGGLSQSAVNEKAGAKTPLSLVIASVCIGICLLFFTTLLKNLPSVILAAIVIVAIRGLIDLKELNRMRKANRFDFVIALLAMASVIYFGILNGVIIAALVSLILIIRIVSAPHIAILGRIPGTDRFTDMKRHHKNEQVPGILIFRVESVLLYFNTSYVYNHIWPKIIKKEAKLKVVIFDLSTSAYIDSSGAKLIKRLHDNLEKRGIALKLAEAHSEVRDILRHEDIEHYFGHIGRRDSIHEVLHHAMEELEEKQKQAEG